MHGCGLWKKCYSGLARHGVVAAFVARATAGSPTEEFCMGSCRIQVCSPRWRLWRCGALTGRVAGDFSCGDLQGGRERRSRRRGSRRRRPAEVTSGKTTGGGERGRVGGSGRGRGGGEQTTVRGGPRAHATPARRGDSNGERGATGRLRRSAVERRSCGGPSQEAQEGDVAMGREGRVDGTHRARTQDFRWHRPSHRPTHPHTHHPR